MPKKGESVDKYIDGRKIGVAKKHRGVSFSGWEVIKYKKFRQDTGYSIMITLSTGEDIWLSKNRIIVQRKKNQVYIEPEYYKQKFPDKQR